MSPVPDVCGKCGGTLKANRRRTQFRCDFCGTVTRLPTAPLLAEPINRPGRPRPARRRRRRPSQRREARIERWEEKRSRGGCVGFAARLILRLITHIISTILLLIGTGVIVVAVAAGDHGVWKTEYGVITGIGLIIFSALLGMLSRF
jgi:hypothetical protein